MPSQLSKHSVITCDSPCHSLNASLSLVYDRGLFSRMGWICSLARPKVRLNAMLVVALCIASARVAVVQVQAAPAAAANQAKPDAKAAGNNVEAQPEDPARVDWRAAMLRTRPSKETCATATYPDQKWHEAPCGLPPGRRPVAPRKRVESHLGGDQFESDMSLHANGKIESAEGSFDKVEGVTSEFDRAAGTTSENDTGVPNSFSLQLNSNTFYTPTCSTAPACKGWVQFIYAATEHSAFIQYWLLSYGTSCPAGWRSDGGFSCYRNSHTISTPAVTIADLHRMKLIGSIGGHWGVPYDDVVAIQIDDLLYAQWSGDPIGGAVNGWNGIEFNVFGNGNGDEAVFNLGSTLVVRASVLLGTATQFNCVGYGFSAESNNMVLPGESPLVAAFGPPSLVFIETYSQKVKEPGDCSTAVVIQGNKTRIPIKPIVAHKS